jgi:hypothetical protein
MREKRSADRLNFKRRRLICIQSSTRFRRHHRERRPIRPLRSCCGSALAMVRLAICFRNHSANPCLSEWRLQVQLVRCSDRRSRTPSRPSQAPFPRPPPKHQHYARILFGVEARLRSGMKSGSGMYVSFDICSFIAPDCLSRIIADRRS